MQKKAGKQPTKKNRRLQTKYKRRRFILLLFGAIILFCIFYGASILIEKNTVADESPVVLGESLVQDVIPVPPKLPDKPEAEENEDTDYLIKIANANWETVIVNKHYPLENEFKVELKPVSLGMQLDERIVEDFKLMLIHAKGAGMNIQVFSAYLSPNDQEEAYNQALGELIEKNNSQDAAVEYLSTRVPEPWVSEHHTGLAAVVSTPDIGEETKFDQTPEFDWLITNAAKYGFTLRYPQGKTAITGYEYNPCHFRYVGTEIAEYLMAHGLTLEEYLYLQVQKLSGDKIISAEPGEDSDNPDIEGEETEFIDGEETSVQADVSESEVPEESEEEIGRTGIEE